MQRNCGEKHSVSANNKLLFRIILILLFAAFLICMYYLMVKPFLVKMVIPTPEKNVHSGIDYFTRQDYLSFEHGQLFMNIVREYGLNELGEATDFYHVDYRHRDNPIHGKYSDYFSVDIKMSDEEYILHRDQTIAGAQHSSNMDSFELYIIKFIPGTTRNRGNVVLTAFCDDLSMVRYILVADTYPDHLSDVYGSLLRMHVPLEWKS